MAACLLTVDTAANANRLVTVDTAANRLGLSPHTIRKMLSVGELTRVYPTKKRGAVRVLEAEIDELITRGKVSLSA